MKTPNRRCKCLNCKVLFLPNYRSRGRQRFCAKPECRKAPKRASQKAWLQKPGNADHFRGKENAERAREWQKAHPGYWRNTARWRNRTLQDRCPAKPVAAEGLGPIRAGGALQDLCASPAPLFVGLIAMLAGSTLQDVIAATTRRLVAKGHDILGTPPGVALKG